MPSKNLMGNDAGWLEGDCKQNLVELDKQINTEWKHLLCVYWLQFMGQIWRKKKTLQAYMSIQKETEI